MTVFLSLLWFFAVESQMLFLPQAAIKFSLNDAITTPPPYSVLDVLLSFWFSCDAGIDVSHDIPTVKPQLNRKSKQILTYCSGDKFLLPFITPNW